MLHIEIPQESIGMFLKMVNGEITEDEFNAAATVNITEEECIFDEE